MKLENILPYAELLVIIFLAITNILIYRYQKSKIKILETTAKNFKDLTDGQTSHIQTFKEMFNVNAIKENMEIQIENAVHTTKKSMYEEFDKLDVNNIIEQMGKDWNELLWFAIIIFVLIRVNPTEGLGAKIITDYLPRNKSELQKLFSNPEIAAVIQKLPKK
jgi:hypothetical protein